MIPGSQKSPGSEKTPPRRQLQFSVRNGIKILELRPSKNTVTPVQRPTVFLQISRCTRTLTVHFFEKSKNTPTSEGPPEGPFGSFCDSKPEPNPGRAPLGGCVVGGAVLEPPKKGRFGGVPDPKVLATAATWATGRIRSKQDQACLSGKVNIKPNK